MTTLEFNRVYHESQMEVALSDAEQKLLLCGRRWGKTFYLANEALDDMFKGLEVLYISPTTKQTDAFWDEIIKALGPLIKYVNLVRGAGRCTFGQGRIRSFTAFIPDRIRGLSAHRLLVDEFQNQKEGLIRVIMPMVADFNAPLVVAMTPASDEMTGDPIVAKRTAEEWIDSGEWEWWNLSSWDNPNNSRRGLTRMKKMMKEHEYRQEVLGEMLQEHPDAIWKLEDISHKIMKNLKLDDAVVAIDPASGQGETGIVCAGIDSDSHIYVLACPMNGWRRPKSYLTDTGRESSPNRIRAVR